MKSPTLISQEVKIRHIVLIRNPALISLKATSKSPNMNLIQKVTTTLPMRSMTFEVLKKFKCLNNSSRLTKQKC